MIPILLIIAALLLIVFVKFRLSRDTRVWDTLPGPPLALFQRDHSKELNNCHFSDNLSKWAKQYGPIYRIHLGLDSRVIVTDPELVKQVLLKNHVFDKNVWQYTLLSKLMGNGIITQPNEELHKYHRSIISPAFALRHVKALVPLFQRKAAILVEDFVAHADTGVPVEIYDYIKRAAADIIGEAAFKYQQSSQRDNSASSVYSIFTDVLGGGVSLIQMVPGLRNFTSVFKKRRAAIIALNQHVHRMIASKAASRGNEKPEIDVERERDLLDVMMHCQNEDGAMLTRAELVDQTKTILLAGYDTTSVCILWTLYMLAKHKDIQEKLAAEVISVIGKDGLPSAEAIDKMPYLFQVLRESLRWRPPVPFLPRNVAEDTTLGGYFLPKGTSLFINIYHQHHHSPVWVKPEEFNPDRWTSDDSESTALMGSYLPFLLGARNCIGSKFAMLDIRVLLAMLIQKLKFEREPGVPEVEARARISLVPNSPIRLLLHKRA